MVPANGIIIFDGDCILCNKAINTILKNDKKAIFRFCTFKNAIEKNLIPDSKTNESIILILGQKLLYRSDALLKIARRMDGLWPILQILILIPRPLLNWLYRYISSRRYSWFGKSDACQRLDINYKDRFL